MKKQITKKSRYFIEEESGQLTAHYTETKDEKGRKDRHLKFSVKGRTVCTIEDGGTNFEYKRGNQTLVFDSAVLADMLTAFIIFQYGEGSNIHCARIYGEKGKFKIRSAYD